MLSIKQYIKERIVNSQKVLLRIKYEYHIKQRKIIIVTIIKKFIEQEEITNFQTERDEQSMVSKATPTHNLVEAARVRVIFKT